VIYEHPRFITIHDLSLSLRLLLYLAATMVPVDRPISDKGTQAITASLPGEAFFTQPSLWIHTPTEIMPRRLISCRGPIRMADALQFPVASKGGWINGRPTSEARLPRCDVVGSLPGFRQVFYGGLSAREAVEKGKTW
jgi:hypothetical protein